MWDHYNSRWLNLNQLGNENCGLASFVIGKSGGKDFPGFNSVPVQTALSILQMQVYYRYKRHGTKSGKEYKPKITLDFSK